MAEILLKELRRRGVFEGDDAGRHADIV
jgi:hypothetical protein